MVFKILYSPSVAHVYCTLFVRLDNSVGAWANCGKFVVRKDEFEDLQAAMLGVTFEERPELI